MKKKIYVAGPYTNGDVEENVGKAMQIGSKLIKAGFNPYVPHLYHFLHRKYPEGYTTWIDLDTEWLKSCDGLVRIPGRSPGADAEEDYAFNHGIPVFRTVSEVKKYFKRKK